MLLEISAERVKMAIVSTEMNLYDILGSVEIGSNSVVYLKEDHKKDVESGEDTGFLGFNNIPELIAMLDSNTPNIMFVSPEALDPLDLARLFEFAMRKNILIRVSDDLDHSNFSLPAILHKGNSENCAQHA